ncbi:hypothetical protein GQ600_25749 [Phytophthora cactorum]|nr:hypothetical protein GQ600_25749 [Phytophthora cactorum]
MRSQARLELRLKDLKLHLLRHVGKLCDGGHHRHGWVAAEWPSVPIVPSISAPIDGGDFSATAQV